MSKHLVIPVVFDSPIIKGLLLCQYNCQEMLVWKVRLRLNKVARQAREKERNLRIVMLAA